MNSSIQRNGAIERPRPKGSDSDTFIRSASLRLGDLNHTSLSGFKRQNSLRPSDLPSIQEAKHKDLSTHTSKEIHMFKNKLNATCFFFVFF